MAHLLANAIRNSFKKKIMCVDVSALNPYVHEWKIRVKVLRKFERAFGEHTTLELILVDSKGQKIHAIMDQEYISRYNRKLIEDQWISITGFKLSLACGTFKPVPHRFVIRWESTTVVRAITPITSDNYYSFASFEDIKGGILDATYCVDLIGQVVCVGNGREEGPPLRDWDAIYLELADREDNRLICRLHGDYATNFFSQWRQCVENIIICILRFARLEVNSGYWVATTTHTCTKVLLNPDCRDAIDMRCDIRSRQNALG